MPTIYLSPSTQEANKYVGGGTEEYYMNLIADEMIPYLNANGIQYTRNDREKTVSNSIRESNMGNYDLHFAVHSNAAPESLEGKIQGADIYYNKGSGIGEEVAEILAENLKEIYPNPSAVKVKETTTLGELSQTNAPAVLIETAYHDNVQDANWIRNNIEEIAKNFVKSISEYFGIPFTSTVIDKEGVVVTNRDPLNIRYRPTTESEVIAQIPKGAIVMVNGKYNNWYIVNYDGVIGYVRSDYINLN